MPDPVDRVFERVHGTGDGLARLVAEAEATWRARPATSRPGGAEPAVKWPAEQTEPAISRPGGADSAGGAALDGERADDTGPAGEYPGGRVSGWRPFEDAFPTFYQFTNRPRG